MWYFERIKRKLALFIIGLLAVSLPGGTVFAVDAEAAPASEILSEVAPASEILSEVAPVSEAMLSSEAPEILVEGTTVYARGIPIVIKAVDDKVLVFDENGRQLSEVNIRGGIVYGGAKNEDVDGSTSVTVENAYLSRIYGGGYSDGTHSANVSGGTDIKVTGTVVVNANGGGYAEGKKGEASANVGGTARLDVPSTVPKPNTGFTDQGHSLYGGGKAYAMDYSAQAVVEETWVRSNGPIYVIQGGGNANRSSGNTDPAVTANADVKGMAAVEAADADVREVYGGGASSGLGTHADTGSVSVSVRTSEAMIVRGGGSASSGGSAKVKGTVRSELVDCSNLYGYVLAGGDASGGGSASVGETELRVTSSVIPVMEQFGGLAAAPLYGGGNASGANSQADVLGTAKMILTDCAGAGTVYGGGSASGGGQANVSAVDLTVSGYKGDRAFSPDQAYFSALIGGGESGDENSSAEAVKGLEITFLDSEAEMVVGGNMLDGAPSRSKAGRSVLRLGSGTDTVPPLAYFDQLILSDTLTVNGFLAVPNGSTAIGLAGEYWQVSDAAIKALDSDAAEEWFTLPNGSLSYSRTSDAAVWTIAQLPKDPPNQGGSPGGSSGSSGGSGGNSGSANGTSKPENSGESTVVRPESTVDQGTAQSAVSASTAEELEKKAAENGSKQIVIAPEMPEEVNETQVEIPKNAMSEAARKSGASVVVETPVASVTLPAETLRQLEAQEGEHIMVAAERREDGAVRVEVRVGNAPAVIGKSGIMVAFSQNEVGSGWVAAVIEADGTETILPKSAVLDGRAFALLDASATIKVVDRGRDFPDLLEHWAREAGKFVSAHQLFAGTEEGQFDPEASMTRGMIASVLHRLEGNEEAAETELLFTDMDPEAFYADDVSWAAELGLIAGDENGEFRGEMGVTREELAAVLSRYVAAAAGEASVEAGNEVLDDFADASQISPWARDSMLLAVQLGLFNGTDTGTLEPQGVATRAETAVVFERLVEWIVKS